ncbi:GDSL family lipase [Beutenbergia cavernae DSM 12333]|uniref:GDSL family lipase n=1 Tax=Beutenbergia cavernae (strain ATCC BAA-8 / DSM 12333 / CCUG 43141 / JCM 11478 / NBRC 16432 / NCIMB 13614 / HKI 0122) TaxID=471853 RepID=C5C1R1_BEUC1|nr:GDSL-type esterase/lipase family protein [Beutenbergia cavernae]ACQ79529.1 GDSL family lipase [Beutenbergia cavernae DSM 12333]
MSEPSPATTPDNLRICVVGDELVAGMGDPRALGWVGRVMARTPAEPPALVVPLAVPHETTTALSARWETEADRRFAPPPADNRLVIGLGSSDLTRDVSLARSRLNLANMLDAAAVKRVGTFVVGPPPRPDIDGARIAELSNAFADVCLRRRVPYVETYAPLRTHDQWLSDVASGDGVRPAQAGYGLLAWLVLHNGWHDWLGVDAE